MLARDGRSKPRAVPGPARAGGLRRRAVHDRRPVRRRRGAACRHDAARGHGDRDEDPRCEAQAQGVRREARRHPVRDRREDGRLARAAREGQPRSGPAAARSRPADPDPAMRRLRGVALALAAGALLPSSAAAAERPPRCPVAAPSAIVIEVSTGEVACATNPDERRSIASTTKLMTALLTLEQAKLSDTFTAANYFPSAAESQIGLERGEKMSVRDLMRGLLVESANDAAVTLAEGVAGSKRAFVRSMNRRAQQLKLTNTHYANPIGLDEAGNYSTARDLVKLATVLRTNRFFRTTVDRPVVRLTTGNRTRTFINRNTLVRTTDWVNGVKSGHTSQAGYVLVGSGRRNGGIQLVSAVLGTPSVG